MELKDKSVELVRKWYADRTAAKGTPSDTFIACAALKFAELARQQWPLRREDYVSKSGRFASTGKQIQAILHRFGEERLYTSEGARTTSGTIEACADLITRFEMLPGFADAPVSVRDRIANEIQRWVYETSVKPFLDAEGISFDLRIDAPPPVNIGAILQAASKRKLAGVVAQHLVRAKLALRYPNKTIDNYSHTTEDKALGRRGDFEVEDTVFHVTMTPGDDVAAKCSRDCADGYRSVLLVPAGAVSPARYFLENTGRSYGVWVIAIEDFVGQNIAELGEFQREGLRARLRALFETYNNRAAACGEPPAAMIKIPEKL